MASSTSRAVVPTVGFAVLFIAIALFCLWMVGEDKKHKAAAVAPINVGLCHVGTKAVPCAMQTAQCTFIVSADALTESLTPVVQCVEKKYSDPCEEKWSHFVAILKEDEAFQLDCVR